MLRQPTNELREALKIYQSGAKQLQHLQFVDVHAWDAPVAF